jgi:hypothetical protein
MATTATKRKVRTRADGSKATGKRSPVRLRNKHQLPENDIRRRMRAAGVKRADEMAFRTIEPMGDTVKLQENGEVTFTAIIASETPVERVGYSYEDGRYEFQEILDMGGCNLERGAIIPMLRDHISWSLEAQIGDWTNFRVDPSNATRMLADGRVFADDGCKIVRERILAKGIKTFSCAYTVDDIAPEEEGDNSRLRVVAWTMYEVSAVAVPADLECVIRGLGAAMMEEQDMAVRGAGAGKGKGKGQGAPRGRGQQQAPKGAPRGQRADEELDEDELELQDAEDELDEDELDEDEQDGEDGDDTPDEGERSQNDDDLRRRARTLGMPRSFLRNYLGTTVTPREMTRKWHARRATERSDDTRDTARIGVPAEAITIDGRRGEQNQLVVRAAVESERAVAQKRAPKFDDNMRGIIPAHGRGIGPRDLLRTAAKRANVRLPDDLDMDAGAFYNLRTVAPHVIADFTYLSNLVLQQLALSEQDVIAYSGDQITKRIEFTTFASGQFVTPPVYDELLETPAGSEVKAGGLGVFDTKGRLATFNRRWGIGRQLFTGNGVGMFANMSQGITNAGVVAENKALQRKLLENPEMSDGVPFFHGSRFNVATNVPMSKEGIGLVQAAALRDGAGVPFVSVIVSPLHMTLWNQLAQVINANTTETYNPFGGKFVPIFIHGWPEDAQLWLTDPRIRAAILRMVMSGQPVPFIKIVETAQFDGFEALAGQDRGVAHGAPRGAFLAFTGDEPADLPTPPGAGPDYEPEDANYEADDITVVLRG